MFGVFSKYIDNENIVGQWRLPLRNAWRATLFTWTFMSGLPIASRQASANYVEIQNNFGWTVDARFIEVVARNGWQIYWLSDCSLSIGRWFRTYVANALRWEVRHRDRLHCVTGVQKNNRNPNSVYKNHLMFQKSASIATSCHEGRPFNRHKFWA